MRSSQKPSKSDSSPQKAQQFQSRPFSPAPTQAKVDPAAKPVQAKADMGHNLANIALSAPQAAVSRSPLQRKFATSSQGAGTPRAGSDNILQRQIIQKDSGDKKPYTANLPSGASEGSYKMKTFSSKDGTKSDSGSITPPSSRWSAPGLKMEGSHNLTKDEKTTGLTGETKSKNFLGDVTTKSYTDKHTSSNTLDLVSKSNYDTKKGEYGGSSVGLKRTVKDSHSKYAREYEVDGPYGKMKAEGGLLNRGTEGSASLSIGDKGLDAELAGKASASVFSGKGEWSGKAGKLSGEVNALKGEASGSVSAHLGPDGAKIGAKGEAKATLIDGKVNYETPAKEFTVWGEKLGVKAYAEVSGEVAASLKGEGGLTLGKDEKGQPKIEASGGLEAFAGAKAGGKLGLMASWIPEGETKPLKLIGGAVGGEVWAGAGAVAKIKASLSPSISYEGELGAAVGKGAGLKFEFEINTINGPRLAYVLTKKGLIKGMGQLKKYYDKAKKWAKEKIKKGVKLMGKGYDYAKELAEDVYDYADEKIDKGIEYAEKGYEAAKEGIGDAYDYGKGKVKKAKKTAKKAWNKVKSWF